LLNAYGRRVVTLMFSYSFNSSRSCLKDSFRFFLLLCALLTALQTANASPWMRSSGESHIVAIMSQSRADEFWDKNRRLQRDNCESKDVDAFIRYEYGYSYYHTLFTDVKWESDQCGGAESKGIPDIKIGIRGRLNPYRNGRTWQASLTIPIQGDIRNRSEPGHGQFGLNVGMYFQFKPDPYLNPAELGQRGYWSWALGTKLFTGGVAHKAWTNLKWSDSLFNTSFDYGIKLNAEYSIGGDDNNDSFSGGENKRVEDYDVITGTLSFSHKLSKKVKGHVSLSQDLAGRNTNKTTALQVGVSKTWK